MEEKVADVLIGNSPCKKEIEYLCNYKVVTLCTTIGTYTKLIFGDNFHFFSYLIEKFNVSNDKLLTCFPQYIQDKLHFILHDCVFSGSWSSFAFFMITSNQDIFIFDRLIYGRKHSSWFSLPESTLILPDLGNFIETHRQTMKKSQLELALQMDDSYSLPLVLYNLISEYVLGWI